MTEKRKLIILDLDRDFSPAQNLDETQLDQTIATPEKELAVAQDIVAKSDMEVSIVFSKDVHPDMLIDDRMENLTGWPEHNIVSGGTDIHKALESVLKMREQSFDKPESNNSSENKPK